MSVVLSVMSAARAGVPLPAGGGPRAGPSQHDEATDSQTLYLELVVNALPTGKIVPVQYQHGRYRVRADDLAKVSIKTAQSGDQMVELSTLRDVKLEYASANQQLLLTVPPDWLPEQTVGGRGLYDRTPAAVDLGFLFNYDVYTSGPINGVGYTSAWTEERLFDSWGTVSNTGVYRQPYVSGGFASGNNGYLRYDTTWTYSDQNRLLTYSAGDLITGALSWTNAVRLGGVSVAKDFSIRPDIVTYPLPQFAGQAAVPTAVDLFINGTKTATAQVNPGPFTMSNVPFINGAGEATVVTTNALGQQVATTVPFYVANTLLQKNLSAYSVSVGAIRRNYGLRSFSYGKYAVSGILRYGVTNDITVEAHAEGGERFGLGGVGIDIGAGVYGVLNGAATQSSMNGASGQQYAFGYSYTSQRFSVTLQRTQRTRGFRDLSVYDPGTQATYQLTRISTQATVAFNPGVRFGTLGGGYFDVRTADGHPTRIANLSYMRPLFRSASLYMSLNKTIGNGGLAAQAFVTIPLGSEGTLTTRVARDNRGRRSEQAQYSRAVPSDGGVGWNLALGGGDSHYQQADMTWRNRYFQLQGGAYGAGGTAGYTRWAELQGSVVAMAGSVMMANRVPDAFAVIDTDGMSGVPVLYENQIVGSTNMAGRLLVPWAPSYYPAKYEIDPLGLPSNVTIDAVDRHVAIRRQAGAVVKFPVTRVVSASIKLVDARGTPLKAGLRVIHRESGQASFVGWDGLTYFERLSAINHLIVSLPGDRHCTAPFPADIHANEMQRIGPVVCGE